MPAKRTPKRRAGKAKATAHPLSAPLSELTKDYIVPIKDMDAWVNRPAEQRHQEAEKKNGYISRPMNSFMLYRSAFADRVKKFCEENNHQVVSQVTGASWPMEPEAIRKEYERLANLERDNHSAAFPNYKFSPNKNKKRASPEEGDSDGEWGGSNRAKRSRTATPSRRGDSPRSRTVTPFDDRFGYAPSPPYQRAVPVEPYGYPQVMHAPAPVQYYDQGVMYDPFQHQMRVREYVQPVEEVGYPELEHAFPIQEQQMSLVAMPGGDDHHLMRASDEEGVGFAVTGDILDPQLTGGYQYQELPSAELASIPVRYGAAVAHPGEATLTDAHGWGELEQAANDFDRALAHYE
jgi:HMG (high mobility group) box